MRLLSEYLKGALIFVGALAALYWGLLNPTSVERWLHARDYKRLISIGEHGAGVIKECLFVGGHVAGGQLPAYFEATVVYQPPAGESWVVREWWPIVAGNPCVEGSPVEVYFLPQNSSIQLASVNNQGIRRVLLERLKQ